MVTRPGSTAPHATVLPPLPLVVVVPPEPVVVPLCVPPEPGSTADALSRIVPVQPPAKATAIASATVSVCRVTTRWTMLPVGL